MPRNREVPFSKHVLNLGAGIQSTRLYLEFCEGAILDAATKEPIRLDAAIFADTGEEPSQVYSHLDWLESLGGPPILRRSLGGRLGDHLREGLNSTGQRFASIPAFTVPEGWNGDPRGIGITRRQCSKEYKVEVIQKSIRQDVLGLAPGRKVRKHITVFQYFGISIDEAGRAKRLEAVYRTEHRWARPRFPLIERFLSRRDCIEYNRTRVPHEVPRSACTFCPYHDNAEWRWVRDNDPEGWRRAIEVDTGMRAADSAVNREFRQLLYVHRSCKPLAEADLSDVPKNFSAAQTLLPFTTECEGVCGN